MYAVVFCMVLCNGTHCPITCPAGTEGRWRYSSTLSLTSVLGGGCWSPLHPACFTAEKENQCPLHRRLDGPQGHSEWVQKILPLLEFQPRNAKPIVSHNTKCPISTKCGALYPKFLLFCALFCYNKIYVLSFNFHLPLQTVFHHTWGVTAIK
jgi:hypothetical protein